MHKSSSSWSENVKQRNAKLKEQLVTLLDLNVDEVILDGFGEYLKMGTRLLLELLMQAEVRQRSGGKYERNGEREYVRWGTEKGKALVNGVKRPVERPRLRLEQNKNGANGEVQLETYKAMNRQELLDGPLMAAILAGVSARRYQTIVSDGLKAKGVSKSAVSRKAIAATKPTVDEFIKRSLAKLELVVVLIDGTHIGGRQMIVAVGIDRNGRKHLLGTRVGATEHEIVCRDLIRDMIERGLSIERPYLFVIDGSKALSAAIKAAFGQATHIQRCQEHKIRDVEGYLPRRERQYYRAKLQAAYGEKSEKRAFERLQKIRLELFRFSEGAANSLTEGMYDTLTVNRLGVTGLLRKSLRTTNVIESLFASTKRYMGRVTNFGDEEQTKRWAIRSLVEAERHLRVVPGKRQIPELEKALHKLS
jgi:putative transposase